MFYICNMDELGVGDKITNNLLLAILSIHIVCGIYGSVKNSGFV